MIHIKKYYQTEQIACSPFYKYFADLKVGVLDIETTGLSPASSKIILGGLISITEDGLLFQQFFAESLNDEAQLLEEYLSAINELDAVVTFNGRHFDIPYIKKRAVINRLPSEVINDMPFNLDLYLAIKDFSELKKVLPNLKQKTVENYFGLWQNREDEISGAESVDLYYEYLVNRDSALKEKILLHNSDDLLQLYRLIPILSKTNIHKAMFSLGFPCNTLSIHTIALEKNTLRILGTQRKCPIDFASFSSPETPYGLFFDKSTRDFEVIIPLIRTSGLALIDLKAFKFDYSELKSLPDCEKDYIIVENNGVVNHMIVNSFIKLFLNHVCSLR